MCNGEVEEEGVKRGRDRGEAGWVNWEGGNTREATEVTATYEGRERFSRKMLNNPCYEWIKEARRCVASRRRRVARKRRRVAPPPRSVSSAPRCGPRAGGATRPAPDEKVFSATPI